MSIIKIPNKYLLKAVHDSIKYNTLANIKNHYGSFINNYIYDPIFDQNIISNNILISSYEWSKCFRELNAINYEKDNLKLQTEYGIIITNTVFNNIIFLQNKYFINYYKNINSYEKQIYIPTINVNEIRNNFILNKKMNNFNFLNYKYK